MIHFVFTEKDRRYVFLKYDTELEYDILHNKLTEYINLVDPICYLPTYTGKPFTNDFLFEYTQPSGNIIFYCAIGLCSTIAEWLKKNDLPFDGLDKKWFRRPIKHTYEQFKEIVNSWNMSRTPREYQYDTAYKILQRFQCVAELSTRAGKTLIAYMIFRYAIEHLGAKRILMIVPSIDLVKQGYNDFSDYAEFFKTECLWGGGKIVESSNLTIATFQTLINFLNKDSKKYNPKFFDTYDMVFVDETHRATASSIKTIISQPFMRNLKIAFGMTGTLPKEGTTERYCVHALLGARIVAIAPRELMDAGYLSQVKIYQHCISYKNKEKQLDTWIRCAEYCISDFDETVNAKGKKERIPLEHPDFLIAYKKTFPAMLAEAKTKIFAQETKSDFEKKMEYRDLLKNVIKCDAGANFHHIEQMMVHFFPERIRYLVGVLDNCPNNTLILAQHVEYIKAVAEELKKAFPDRPVICVYGGSKERKNVKDILKENNNCLLVAGYSIMGTGITLSNLCYGVLFESFASHVINIQSIGRGLGLKNAEFSNTFIEHDITDHFDSKVASSKIFMQGLERRKIYDANSYPYEVIEKTI